MPNEDVPDLYTDAFTLAQSPYGVALTFLKTPTLMPGIPGQLQNEPVAVVRMSLEHAKVMAMLLRKQLKQYELENLGDPINIPRAVLQQMNISLEEW